MDALVEFWSAISAGALLIFIVAMLYVGLLPIWAALLLAIAGYVAIEAAIRRRLIEPGAAGHPRPRGRSGRSCSCSPTCR